VATNESWKRELGNHALSVVEARSLFEQGFCIRAGNDHEAFGKTSIVAHDNRDALPRRPGGGRGAELRFNVRSSSMVIRGPEECHDLEILVSNGSSATRRPKSSARSNERHAFSRPLSLKRRSSLEALVSAPAGASRASAGRRRRAATRTPPWTATQQAAAKSLSSSIV